MQMLSQALPFSKLLPEVCARLTEATLLLPGIKSRNVRRVGIISTTQVAEDELPPGISRLIGYIGRPWGGRMDFLNAAIAGEIEKTAAWTDRCLHNLMKPEGADQLIKIDLDWQRNFAAARAVTKETLKEMLDKAQKDALSYFEDVAEGSRFDEEVIRSV